MTENFIKCPNTAACLGIKSPDYNPMGTCAESYGGILCTECDLGYSSTGTFQCSLCPEKTSNIVRITFILLAAVLGVGWMIRYFSNNKF